jgi:hypothetical protein
VEGAILPSIIRATCVFDTKKYKTVDAVLAVSPCLVWNKKIFDFFYFYSHLQAFLVETMSSRSRRLLRKFRSNNQLKGQVGWSSFAAHADSYLMKIVRETTLYDESARSNKD